MASAMTLIRGGSSAVRLASFNRKLDRVIRDTQSEMRLAIGKAAQMVVEEQRRLAPVQSGALRNSITWNWGSAPKYATMKAVRKSRDSSMMAVISAGNEAVRYAHLVEFGTAPHSLAKGASRKRGRLQDQGVMHPGATAQPFFWPGWRLARNKARRMIRKDLQTAVRRAAA